MRKHISSIYLASYINWFAICVPLHADTPCQLLPRNAEIMRHEQTSVGEQARSTSLWASTKGHHPHLRSRADKFCRFNSFNPSNATSVHGTVLLTRWGSARSTCQQEE
jgi:hypothetical protein